MMRATSVNAICSLHVDGARVVGHDEEELRRSVGQRRDMLRHVERFVVGERRCRQRGGGGGRRGCRFVDVRWQREFRHSKIGDAKVAI